MKVFRYDDLVHKCENKKSLLKKDSHRLGMGKLFEDKNVWY